MSDFNNINRFDRSVRAQVFKGKTLARALMNNFAGRIEIAGRILDLGSKSKAPSYHRYLKLSQPYSVQCVDLVADGVDVIKMDLEKTFPINSGEYDAILCFNLLEHIYDAENLLSESRRVLKAGGKLVGTVPFLVRYHADPHDYRRYTHEALERLAREAGFTGVQIVPLGLGPFTAAASICGVWLPRIVRYGLHCMAACIDRFFFKKKALVDVLGYGFVFE